MEKLIIVGAGCAGYTAAIYAARAKLDPLILTGELPGGQLTQTTMVDNYPGFKDGILGFDLVEEMRQQAERFGCRCQSAAAESCELVPGGPHTLRLTGGEEVQGEALIIATGAKPRRLDLVNEAKLENKGVSYCAICDGAFFRDVPHVVVGGGDSAMEEAVFLTKFASKVTIIHRRDALRASTFMAERALDNPKIEVAWNSVVHDILDVDQDQVTAVVLEDVHSGALREVPCGAVFVAIGHTPSTAAFRGQVEMDDAGYIRLQEGSSRTSVDGVFGAGDCADHVYRQAVTAAGMGCRAAIDAERWLAAREG